jgi:hydrogenase maturation protease
VIGLGNLLSGDDGFGARVLELLVRNPPAPPAEVTLVDAHTDLLNHIEDFSAHECVLLIDAILDPESKLGPCGRIAVFEEEQFRSWPDASPGVHQMSPLMAVKLFRSLHPETLTKIALIGLLADRIGHAPVYATDERIQEAAAVVRNIIRSLPMSGKKRHGLHGYHRFK